MGSNSLVEFWRQFWGPKGFHPKDDLTGIQFVDWEQHESNEFPKALHQNFVPVPFVGNLGRASVFILMLNPGYDSVTNYPEEADGSPLIPLQIRNLRNKLKVNWCLDPKWKDTGGGIYWRKVFRRLAEEIKAELGFSTIDRSYSEFSNHVAFIQLVPYHSKECNVTPRMASLASVNACKEYVRKELVPSGRLIVVHRAKTHFALPDLPNVVKDGLPRSQYFNRSEPKRIKKELLEVIVT